jgi:hypothetical protein
MGVDCTTYVMLGYKLDKKSTLGKALYDACEESCQDTFGELKVINDGMSGEYIVIGKVYGSGWAFQDDLFVEIDVFDINQSDYIAQEMKHNFSFGEEIVNNIPLKLLAFHYYS